MPVIKEVTKKSPAARAKIKAGDKLISVNANAIKDVLDYEFYTAEENIQLKIKTKKGEYKDISIQKGEYEDLGLLFDTYLIDTKRSCKNKCVFCFIDQLPKGMRESLYFKDDDMRLSFLLGNYITLTNLDENDIKRIKEMHISPINVSVHATNSEIRQKMLNNKKAGNCLTILKELAEAGIQLNCQIVVCPGINDGAVLAQSLADLLRLYPAMSSISVVPVGLTSHRKGLYELKPVDKEKATETIEIADSFGEKSLEVYKTRIVYCADELYLKAEKSLPPKSYYESFPQLENGVGMMSLFESEFLEALEENIKQRKKVKTTIVCGKSAEQFLNGLVKKAQSRYDIDCEVAAIENIIFGEEVNVSGLVCGGDIINELGGRHNIGKVLIPKSMLRHNEDMFLDNITLKQLKKALKAKEVKPVEVNGKSLLLALIS